MQSLQAKRAEFPGFERTPRDLEMMEAVAASRQRVESRNIESQFLAMTKRHSPSGRILEQLVTEAAY